MYISPRSEPTLARRNETQEPPDPELSFGFLLCEARVNGTCPRLDSDIAGMGVLISVIITSVATLLLSILAQTLLHIQDHSNKKPKSVKIYAKHLNRFVLDLGDQQLITGFAFLVSSWAKSAVKFWGAHSRLSAEICLLCLTAFASTAPIHRTLQRCETVAATLKQLILTLLVLLLLFTASFVQIITSKHMTWTLGFSAISGCFVLTIGSSLIISGQARPLVLQLSMFIVVQAIPIALGLAVAIISAIFGSPKDHSTQGGAAIVTMGFFLAVLMFGIVCAILMIGFEAIAKCMAGMPAEKIVRLLSGCFGNPAVDEEDELELINDEQGDKNGNKDSEQSKHPKVTKNTYKPLGRMWLRIFFYLTSETGALALVLYQRFGAIDPEKHPDVCSMRDFITDKWGSGQALTVLLLALPALSLFQAYFNGRDEAIENRIKPTDAISTEYRDDEPTTLDSVGEQTTNPSARRRRRPIRKVRFDDEQDMVATGVSVDETQMTEMQTTTTTRKKVIVRLPPIAASASEEQAPETDDRVQAAFHADFPNGFTTIATDGGNLWCGLRAVIHTLAAMHPTLPQPSLQMLLDVYGSDEFQDFQRQFGLSNTNNFHIDQIGAIVQFWGETYHDLPLQVGAIVRDGSTFLVPYNGTKAPTIIWIYNAPVGRASANGDDHDNNEDALRHFSGVRPKLITQVEEQETTQTQPRNPPKAKLAQRRASDQPKLSPEGEAIALEDLHPNIR